MPKNEFLPRLAVLLAVTTCVAIAAPSGYTGSATGTDWDTFGTPGNGVSQFAGPTGIFVNPAGKIYVVDARNSRLVRVNNMTGTGWMTFGMHGSGVNQFTFPYGIFVTSAGQIFVTDIYRLVRINGMTGTGWTTFGTRGDGVGQFKGLTGISVNSAGQIFVADTGNNRIVRIDDMTGSGWATFGSTGSGVNQFIQPQNVFVSTTGQIYVADAGNNRLVRVNDMNGSGWTTFDTHTVRGINHWYWSPTGVFVNSVGQIFMTDLGNQRIVRIDDMAGTGRTIFNTVGECGFTSSPGIFLNVWGEIFVADYAASRIIHASAPPVAPEPKPDDRRAPNCLSPPATTGTQLPIPEREFKPRTAQDEAKGLYHGPLGDFLVTHMVWPDRPPCPKPSRQAKNYKTSELYSPVFGENPEALECADGKIWLMSTYIFEPSGNQVMVGKAYFVGAAKVPFEVSLDRLMLLTIAGKPAIARLLAPGVPWSPPDLAVIERFPSNNRPGIMVTVQGSDRTLEEIVALAARIIGR